MEETLGSKNQQKKAAGESTLNELHEKVAAAYLGILNATPCSECGQCLPSAADLKAAAQFLKDNKITCDRSEGRMDDLANHAVRLLDLPIELEDVTDSINLHNRRTG